MKKISTFLIFTSIFMTTHAITKQEVITMLKNKEYKKFKNTIENDQNLITKQFEDGDTLLHIAANKDSYADEREYNTVGVENINDLLLSGALPEKKNKKNETPQDVAQDPHKLIFIIFDLIPKIKNKDYEGFKNQVTTLVKKGFDINTTFQDYCLLHFVADDEAYANEIESIKYAGELVDFLINKGININQANPKTGTPLTIAINTRSPSAFKRLLKEDTIDLEKALSKVPKEDLPAILFNCVVFLPSNKANPAIQKLVSEPPEEQKELTQIAIEILRRIYKKEYDQFKQLVIKNKQYINEPLGNDTFLTILCEPVYYESWDEYMKKSPEIIKFLIDQDADPNSGNKKPLHFAARFNNSGLIKTLIQNEASVDTKDEYGNTPLHEATDYDHKKAIETLIQKGANVEAQDEYKSTPLHKAAINNSAEAIKILIKNKANIEAQNNYGNTPLDIAKAKNNQEAIDALTNSASQQTPVSNLASKLKVLFNSLTALKNTLKSLIPGLG